MFIIGVYHLYIFGENCSLSRQFQPPTNADRTAAPPDPHAGNWHSCWHAHPQPTAYRRGNDQRPSVVLINSTTLTKHGQRVQL